VNFFINKSNRASFLKKYYESHQVLNFILTINIFLIIYINDIIKKVGLYKLLRLSEVSSSSISN